MLLVIMRTHFSRILAIATLAAAAIPLVAKQQDTGAKMRPEDTEFYEPVPKKITPGANNTAPPSDAIVLFEGKNMDQWVTNKDKSPAKWDVHDGVVTVDKAGGNIETKRSFKNYQLHIEWMVPADIEGSGQARGNSGVFLASTGPGDDGYELQVLDNYENKTYTNGMAGSIYKQAVPLVNPSRKPGEWQTYDIVWTAPTFDSDGKDKTPAYVTVFFNGVLVENHFQLQGETRYIGKPFYKAFDGAPIKLQAHGDKSKPDSFRNIWVRDLP